MGSESWKELMFLLELLVKKLLPLLSRPLHLHVLPLYRLLLLSSKLLLLLRLLTMTMLMHQLILTSTHSSTLMTPLTVTSSSTGTEPTLEATMSMLLPTVSHHVLTVLVSTHSSTHLMPLTNKLVSLLVTKLVFSR